jgi:hypothetical protein
MLRGILGKVLLVVYVVVGLIVANSHHYFAHLDRIKPIASGCSRRPALAARPVWN